MKKILLTPKKITGIPIEADVISPNLFTGKKIHEIESLKVFQGNTSRLLSDFFKVEGDTSEIPQKQMIIINGSVPHIKYIGKKMSTGVIHVKGDVGMHTGSQMKGGEIKISGKTGDWTGAEMNGGLIIINESAGNLLGAAYRGSNEGMKGGTILVNGDVGTETASFMRRGMIIIKGNTGAFTGVHMNGGEIFIFGETGKRAGAQAKGNGGFIACFGGIKEILPTYRYDTTYTPNFMRLYLKQMKNDLGFNEAENYIDIPLKRYRGDLAVGGNAEILVAKKA